MDVFADLRWPARTGIGVVQSEILTRTPADVALFDLSISRGIGSPLSPVSVALALARRHPKGGVFWSPGFMPPAYSPLPAVVTVHDLTHLHYYSKTHVAYYNRIMKPLYRRCRAIICVSDFTRNEFLEWSGIDPDKVSTIHNGIHVEAFRCGPDAGLSFPYVLYPGNRRNYKNLDRLLQAFAASHLAREGISLLLTGEPDGHLLELASRLNIDGQVRFAGPRNDREMAALYRGARIVAFVSLYEGFGLPILEAMAASVPVLTSRVSAMPEVAGNAALIVDPTSIEEIAGGLDRLHSEESTRERLKLAGNSNVKRFDWGRTATLTWRKVRESASE